MQHIKTPVDLVSLPCITPAIAQQAIDTAYPYPLQGFILWADSAPDVIADPVLLNFLWGKTVLGVKPVDSADLEVYYYNGTSWELIPFQVLPGSITLADIDITGSSPLDILQINSGGTALVWIDVISAITNNTIPPVKLLVPNNTDDFLLTAFAGTKAFTEISAFFIAIDDNIIPVAKLVKGSANPLKQVLTTKVDGSAIEWSALDVANIGAAGYIAGQFARRNAGNTAWEPYSIVGTGPVFLSVTSVYSGGPIGWTQYAASAVTLAGKSAAIIQVETLWNTSDDGQVSVSARAASGGPELLVGRIGSVDAAATSQQSVIPLTPDGKFDYEVITSGTASPTVTIKLVGYYN